jgi:hypothetical protein
LALLPIAHPEKNGPPPKLKKRRINWAVGENAEVMRCATDEWDNGKGIDENGEKLALNQFANLRGINPNTFYTRYAHPDRNKRQALGSQVGAKPKLSTDEQEFIAQVTARCDRANDLICIINKIICALRTVIL